VNDPRVTNEIMAAIHIHAMSYLLEDKNAAKGIRDTAIKQLEAIVQKLKE
jgi:hypothetical protein